MGFKMAGKVRHLLERDGRYYARKIVPKEWRAFLEGKTEFREPLGADRSAAIDALPDALVRFKAELHVAKRAAAAARHTAPIAPAYPLSAEQIAFQSYHDRLAHDEAQRQADPQYMHSPIDDGFIAELRIGAGGGSSDAELAELVGRLIEYFRARGNTDVTFGSPEWRHLARLLCRSELEALARLYERDEGDYSGKISDPALALALIEPIPAPPAALPVSIMGLFDDYIAARREVGIGAEAERRWIPAFRDLCRFLGHDDARKITKQNLKDWRSEARKTRSAKTISDVWLGSVRTVLNWAVREDRLDANVAQDVRQELPKKNPTRERGYTDAEAVLVLEAACSYLRPDKEHEATASAKKWVPWLSAFTGARVTELTQLRKEDVRQEGKHWVIRITPEAGTVKAGGYRDVPLHPQLVDLGFPDFVASSPSGPLFYRTATGAGSLSGARTVSGRISTWLGKLELVPKGVSPSHGWRHRFKTVGREIGSSDRVLDAICGHAGRTAGDNYGDVSVAAMAKVIGEFPRYLTVTTTTSA